MGTTFRILNKARGGESAFSIFAGGFALCMCVGLFILARREGIPLGVFLYALLFAGSSVGLVFIVRAGLDLVRAREWEFCASKDRIYWLVRDCRGERVECEIFLQEIRALVYRGGDSESGASLKIERVDGSLIRFPLVGAPSDPQLLDFINYWRDEHPTVPIKNLDTA